jgi:hypothetical protein
VETARVNTHCNTLPAPQGAVTEESLLVQSNSRNSGGTVVLHAAVGKGGTRLSMRASLPGPLVGL